jgi:NCS1 family nucleobase:cation symporter-1
VPVGLTIAALLADRLDIAVLERYLSWFYDYGWFTGSILGGLLYYVVARK